MLLQMITTAETGKHTHTKPHRLEIQISPQTSLEVYLTTEDNICKEKKNTLKHLHQHNIKNQIALEGQVSHTSGDDVTIHINISMQLPAQVLHI